GRVVVARIHGTGRHGAPVAPHVGAYEPRMTRAEMMWVKPGNFRRNLAPNPFRAFRAPVSGQWIAVNKLLADALLPDTLRPGGVNIASMLENGTDDEGVLIRLAQDRRPLHFVRGCPSIG